MRRVLHDPKELRRLHYDLKMSPLQIATHLGVQKATVYAAFKRHGIERRAPNKNRIRDPLYEIADKTTITAMLANGKTVIEISTHYGYTADTVYNLLKRYNIKPPGKQQRARSITKRKNLEASKVRDYYQSNGIRATAAHFGVGVRVMETYLTNNKIPIRRRSEKLAHINPEQVQTRHRNGENIPTLARSYECSTHYIRRCLGLDGKTPPNFPTNP